MCQCVTWGERLATWPPSFLVDFHGAASQQNSCEDAQCVFTQTSGRVIIYVFFCWYLSTWSLVPSVRETNTHAHVFWSRDTHSEAQFSEDCVNQILALMKFWMQLENLAQSLWLHSDVCYKMLNICQVQFSSNKIVWLFLFLVHFKFCSFKVSFDPVQY